MIACKKCFVVIFHRTCVWMCFSYSQSEMLNGNEKCMIGSSSRSLLFERDFCIQTFLFLFFFYQFLKWIKERPCSGQGRERKSNEKSERFILKSESFLSFFMLQKKKGTWWVILFTLWNASINFSKHFFSFLSPSRINWMSDTSILEWNQYKKKNVVFLKIFIGENTFRLVEIRTELFSVCAMLMLLLMMFFFVFEFLSIL